VRCRIVLLARCPRAGWVKTRLAETIGTPATLGLYRAFLADQLAFLGSFAAQHELEWCADGDPGAEFARIARDSGVRLTRQVDGDLGARMLAALDRSSTDGVAATVVVGADSPTLPERLVRAAFSRLAAAEGGVVVPTDDGGYALLGLRLPPARPIFREIPWGGPAVLAATRERASGAGLPLFELQGWYDVDDAAGLRRLCAELGEPGARARAPETARAILDLGIGRMV